MFLNFNFGAKFVGDPENIHYALVHCWWVGLVHCLWDGLVGGDHNNVVLAGGQARDLVAIGDHVGLGQGGVQIGTTAACPTSWLGSFLVAQ